MARDLRELAKQVSQGEVSFDQAAYEHLRLQATFQWLPMVKRAG
jgi:hypothetical protein